MRDRGMQGAVDSRQSVGKLLWGTAAGRHQENVKMSTHTQKERRESSAAKSGGIFLCIKCSKI